MPAQCNFGGKLFQACLAFPVYEVQIGNVLDFVRSRLVTSDSLEAVEGAVAKVALPCLVTISAVVNIRIAKFAKDRGLKTVKGFTIRLYTL